MKELYNLMAEIISCLLKNVGAEFYVHYDSRTKRKVDKAKSFIMQEVPSLFDKDAKGFTGIEDPEEMIPGIRKTFEICRIKKNYDCLLDMLAMLDGALEEQLGREFESRQGKHTEECLNTNWNTYRVGILPRCRCYWERSHRGSQHYNRIDTYMYNLLVIDYSKWKDWRIVHHFLPENLLSRAGKEEKLRVAFSPFKNENDFEVHKYEADEELRFSVEYTGDVEADARRVERIIQSAAEKKVDILLFPEMLGNTKMEELISGYLQNPKQQEELSPPALLLLPTVWEEHRNMACLLDGTGDIVCRQSKQYPFKIERGHEQETAKDDKDAGEESGQNSMEGFEENWTGMYTEDIIPDHVIHLIHGEGIGRMVIMICRDFLTRSYTETVLESLKATLILIPSYSTGYHDFQQMLGKLLAEDCCAVWVNACVMAGSRPQEITGMVLHAGKERIKEHYKIFSRPQGCGCAGDCLELWELYYRRDIS